MTYPSVKTLMQIKDVSAQDAETIRGIMKKHIPVSCACGRMNDIGHADAYPYNVCSYYANGKHRYSRMAAIDKVLGTHGVEYIPCGRSANSPAIYYCNMGDTYDATVMKIRGRFVVGCWGSYVERGNYS